jgi:hypothetical protein
MKLPEMPYLRRELSALPDFFDGEIAVEALSALGPIGT